MLKSFPLQSSSLNFRITKHKNVTHFINVKGWKANTSGKLWLHKLVIPGYFKIQVQYVTCVPCEICLILTKHCLI